MRSDSVSAIKSIGIGSYRSRQDLIYEILFAIRDAPRSGIEISLMWISAHTGIATNEKVDKLAKRGVIKEGIDVNINLSKAEGKSIVWKEINLEWQQILGAGDKREAPVFIAEQSE